MLISLVSLIWRFLVTVLMLVRGPLLTRPLRGGQGAISKLLSLQPFSEFSLASDTLVSPQAIFVECQKSVIVGSTALVPI